jgi:hypothetical protein
MNSVTQPHGTIEQLRDAIDSGRTGEKVPFHDPAAAPLGADEEAAGTPLPRDAVTATLARETGRTSHRDQDQRGLGHAWILVILIAVAAFAILAWGAQQM